MTWLKLVTRKNSVLIESIYRFASSRNLLDIGFDYSLRHHKIIDGNVYCNEEEFNQLVERIRNLMHEDDMFLSDYAENCYVDIDEFSIVWEKLSKIDYGNVSDIELKSFFQEYLVTLYALMAYMYTPLAIERIITEELNKISDDIMSLSEPLKMSYSQEEQLELLRIASIIQADPTLKFETILDDKEINKELNRHLEKWAWLGDHNFKCNFWRIDDLLSRLKVALVEDCFEKRKALIEDHEKKKQEFLTLKEKLSEEEFELVRISKEMANLRVYRLDVVYRSEYLVSPLLFEIARRANLSFRDLTNLAANEVLALFGNWQVDHKKIDYRKKGFALLVDEKGLVIVTDGLDLLREKIGATGEIKGTIACSGVVQGHVKIIEDVLQLSKILKGDILVTSMTTPDFVSAMEKAAAFVTDEGGILCHAAIVSREMNKPCIIGTKNATSILKDGDFIEVDANSGTVRKIR